MPQLPAGPSSPDELLRAAGVQLAGLRFVEDSMRVDQPATATAWWRSPAEQRDFWAAVERRLRAAGASADPLDFRYGQAERLIEVRLRRTGEQDWAAAWWALADPWLDERGRPLLPVPDSDRTTSVLLSTDGLVLQAGDGYRTVLGWAQEPEVGRYWPDTLAGDAAVAAERLLRELAEAGTVDRIVPAVSARPRWFRVQLRRAVQGGTDRSVLVVQVEDLTDAGRDGLVAQLIRDPLTGLYNRRAFFDLAGLDAAATAMFVGVLVVKVRRFKRINDLWGQSVADRCVAEVAHWLRSMAAAEDVLVRLAGSQFVLLCTEHSTAANRLGRASERTVHVGGKRILLSLQAGWATRSPSTSLLVAAEEAESALAVAERQAWRTVVPWTAEISQDAVEAAAAEEAVQQAVAGHQEAVRFQPVLNLAERRVSGIESLVRMGGPAVNLPIDRILDASHKLGLTPQLAERVYDLAFTEGLRLREVFPDCLLGVNVSREFLSTGLAIETVLGSARRAGVPLDQVVVELTEDVAAGLSTELLSSELHRGHELGMQMVIDDFGRGETSLSLLRKLPLSGIKLDRSLLPLDDDERAWDFVEGTVSLLASLTDRIIAEGIETELQSTRLRAIGVDLQQGYFFGKPETSGYWLEHGLTIPG